MGLRLFPLGAFSIRLPSSFWSSFYSASLLGSVADYCQGKQTGHEICCGARMRRSPCDGGSHSGPSSGHWRGRCDLRVPAWSAISGRVTKAWCCQGLRYHGVHSGVCRRKRCKRSMKPELVENEDSIVSMCVSRASILPYVLALNYVCCVSLIAVAFTGANASRVVSNPGFWCASFLRRHGWEESIYMEMKSKRMIHRNEESQSHGYNDRATSRINNHRDPGSAPVLAAGRKGMSIGMTVAWVGTSLCICVRGKVQDLANHSQDKYPDQNRTFFSLTHRQVLLSSACRKLLLHPSIDHLGMESATSPC